MYETPIILLIQAVLAGQKWPDFKEVAVEKWPFPKQNAFVYTRRIATLSKYGTQSKQDYNDLLSHYKPTRKH